MRERQRVWGPSELPAPATILVKPAGPDCNLRCNYCFYRGKEVLFSAGPHRMTKALLERVVRQHLSQEARDVTFCWQGGEPTLLGLSFFEQVVTLEARHGRGHRVANALQTNATLLDQRWAAFLKEYEFLVGVSLDGGAALHDANRRDRAGRGTWAEVVGSIKMLLDAGVATNVLSVVTEAAAGRGRDTYEALLDLGLRHLQFIPLVHPDPEAATGDGLRPVRPATYGSFLCEVFDRWVRDLGSPEQSSVRAFDALLAHYLGLAPPDCTMQAHCDSYLVVEHDGTVYPCDFFVEPRWELGNVSTSPLPRLWDSAPRREFRALKAQLPLSCRTCEWLAVCGGGCPKDRPRGDLTRPSILCEAYRALFRHAHERLRALAAEVSGPRGSLATHTAEVSGHTESGSRSSVGRNDPCPCGSRSKYKKCCGRK